MSADEQASPKAQQSLQAEESSSIHTGVPEFNTTVVVSKTKADEAAEAAEAADSSKHVTLLIEKEDTSIGVEFEGPDVTLPQSDDILIDTSVNTLQSRKRVEDGGVDSDGDAIASDQETALHSWLKNGRHEMGMPSLDRTASQEESNEGSVMVETSAPIYSDEETQADNKTNLAMSSVTAADTMDTSQSDDQVSQLTNEPDFSSTVEFQITNDPFSTLNESTTVARPGSDNVGLDFECFDDNFVTKADGETGSIEGSDSKRIATNENVPMMNVSIDSAGQYAVQQEANVGEPTQIDLLMSMMKAEGATLAASEQTREDNSEISATSEKHIESDSTENPVTASIGGDVLESTITFDNDYAQERPANSGAEVNDPQRVATSDSNIAIDLPRQAAADNDMYFGDRMMGDEEDTLRSMDALTKEIDFLPHITSEGDSAPTADIDEESNISISSESAEETNIISDFDDTSMSSDAVNTTTVYDVAEGQLTTGQGFEHSIEGASVTLTAFKANMSEGHSGQEFTTTITIPGEDMDSELDIRRESSGGEHLSQEGDISQSQRLESEAGNVGGGEEESLIEKVSANVFDSTDPGTEDVQSTIVGDLINTDTKFHTSSVSGEAGKATVILLLDDGGELSINADVDHQAESSNTSESAVGANLTAGSDETSMSSDALNVTTVYDVMEGRLTTNANSEPTDESDPVMLTGFAKVDWQSEQGFLSTMTIPGINTAAELNLLGEDPNAVEKLDVAEPSTFQYDEPEVVSAGEALLAEGGPVDIPSTDVSLSLGTGNAEKSEESDVSISSESAEETNIISDFDEISVSSDAVNMTAEPATGEGSVTNVEGGSVTLTGFPIADEQLEHSGEVLIPGMADQLELQQGTDDEMNSEFSRIAPSVHRDTILVEKVVMDIPVTHTNIPLPGQMDVLVHTGKVSVEDDENQETHAFISNFNGTSLPDAVTTGVNENQSSESISSNPIPTSDQMDASSKTDNDNETLTLDQELREAVERETVNAELIEVGEETHQLNPFNPSNQFTDPDVDVSHNSNVLDNVEPDSVGINEVEDIIGMTSASNLNSEPPAVTGFHEHHADLNAELANNPHQLINQQEVEITISGPSSDYEVESPHGEESGLSDEVDNDETGAQDILTSQMEPELSPQEMSSTAQISTNPEGSSESMTEQIQVLNEDAKCNAEGNLDDESSVSISSETAEERDITSDVDASVAEEIGNVKRTTGEDEHIFVADDPKPFLDSIVDNLAGSSVLTAVELDLEPSSHPPAVYVDVTSSAKDSVDSDEKTAVYTNIAGADSEVNLGGESTVSICSETAEERDITSDVDDDAIEQIDVKLPTGKDEHSSLIDGLQSDLQVQSFNDVHLPNTEGKTTPVVEVEVPVIESIVEAAFEPGVKSDSQSFNDVHLPNTKVEATPVVEEVEVPVIESTVEAAFEPGVESDSHSYNDVHLLNTKGEVTPVLEEVEVPVIESIVEAAFEPGVESDSQSFNYIHLPNTEGEITPVVEEVEVPVIESIVEASFEPGVESDSQSYNDMHLLNTEGQTTPVVEVEVPVIESIVEAAAFEPGVASNVNLEEDVKDPAIVEPVIEAGVETMIQMAAFSNAPPSSQSETTPTVEDDTKVSHVPSPAVTSDVFPVEQMPSTDDAHAEAELKFDVEIASQPMSETSRYTEEQSPTIEDKGPHPIGLQGDVLPIGQQEVPPTGQQNGQLPLEFDDKIQTSTLVIHKEALRDEIEPSASNLESWNSQEELSIDVASQQIMPNDRAELSLNITGFRKSPILDEDEKGDEKPSIAQDEDFATTNTHSEGGADVDVALDDATTDSEVAGSRDHTTTTTPTMADNGTRILSTGELNITPERFPTDISCSTQAKAQNVKDSTLVDGNSTADSGTCLDSVDRLVEGLDDLHTPSIDTRELDLSGSLLNAMTETPEVETLPSLPAQDEAAATQHVKEVIINDQTLTLDMAVVEPYKDIFSHGGFVDEEHKHAILTITACEFPDRSNPNYMSIMDQLFIYVYHSVQELVVEHYTIIYLQGAAKKSQLPGLTWMKRCHDRLSRSMRKGIQGLYIVHPTFWTRTVIFWSKPFISSKFSRKVHLAQTLEQLNKRISLQTVPIADQVRIYDARHTHA